MNNRRAASLFQILAILGLAGLILYQGHVLTRNSNRPVPLEESSGFVRVDFPGAPGRLTRGFFHDAPGKKAFILAHGNSSNGASMLARARWLVSQGYSVLIPDLQAHGETPGKRKTFGWREGEDVTAAYRYLQSHMGKAWIGGIGSSLGGASLLKAASSGIRFDVLVLESVYADIRTAARNRLESNLGWAGTILEPLLTLQLPLWCGVSGSELNPTAWAKKVECDALVLVGGVDKLAMPWESEAIFANLSSKKKRILKLKGAGHVDLFAYDQPRYSEVLLNFLKGSLSEP